MSDFLSTPSFATIKALRPDYGPQFEILVAYLYNHVVGPGSFAVDGGANSGLHAVPLANLVGKTGHLVCFEPVPDTFARLRQGLAFAQAEGFVTAHMEALGHQAGEVAFIVDRDNPALSRVLTKLDRIQPQHEEITVPVVTLDDRLGDQKVDFIKLDLEGYDFRGLQGGKQVLARSRPPVIFENSRSWTAKKCGYTEAEFFGFFGALGYLIFDLHNRPLTPESWTAEDMAFEFLAIHKDDPRTDTLRQAITYFWDQVGTRPVLSDWRDCVFACRKPVDYVGKSFV